MPTSSAQSSGPTRKFAMAVRVGRRRGGGRRVFAVPATSSARPARRSGQGADHLVGGGIRVGGAVNDRGSEGFDVVAVPEVADASTQRGHRDRLDLVGGATDPPGAQLPG